MGLFLAPTVKANEWDTFEPFISNFGGFLMRCISWGQWSMRSWEQAGLGLSKRKHNKAFILLWPLCKLYFLKLVNNLFCIPDDSFDIVSDLFWDNNIIVDRCRQKSLYS